MDGEFWSWLKIVKEFARVRSRRRELIARAGIDYTIDSRSLLETVSRIHPVKMRLRVEEIVEKTPSSKLFRFSRVDGRLPLFQPGQYLSLSLEIYGVQTNRPYSITSAPGSDIVELIVKENPGGFVAPYLLEQLRVGDHITSCGPLGHFRYKPLIDGNDLVFLAGGSGIAPFISMIKDCLENDPYAEITLLYGCRSADDVIFGDELEELCITHRHFKYLLIISDSANPTTQRSAVHYGFLTADLIRKNCVTVYDKTFFISGPPAMVEFCKKELDVLEIPQYRRRVSAHGILAEVTLQKGWPTQITADAVFLVEVVGQKIIKARATDPLICSLERAGIVTPAQCRCGECGACRTKILSGEFFQLENASVRESDRRYGYVHACSVYPLSDLRIRL